MHSDLVRLRCDLAYDGTNFSGWAKQPGLRTVQGEIERALETLLRTPPASVALTVGGRTDAGVHARGQVCHVDVTSEQEARFHGRNRAARQTDTLSTDSPQNTFENAPVNIPASRVNGILKRQGAPDIVIHSITKVPHEFDARFSALARRYEYRLRPAGVKEDPLTRGFTVQLPYAVDLELMQEASASLTGLRDFGAFCKAREGATSVRTLTEFSWRQSADGTLVGRIAADAFCHSMVRALVGAVAAVGGGRVTLRELREIADARQRTSRFAVMPAHGLSLEEISYPEASELAARAEQTRARREPLDEDCSAR